MSEQEVGARLRGMEFFSAGNGTGDGRFGDALGVDVRVCRTDADRHYACWLRSRCRRAMNKLTSAGHKQAMSVLQPAIAHFGEAEHSLDDPDRMFDPGPHFGLGTIFLPLDLVNDAAVTVAAIGEVLGPWGVLADHRPLAAVGLIAPHAGFVAMQ